MIKDLDLTGYSKGYFYALKRKVQGIDKPTAKKSVIAQAEVSGPKTTRMEILAVTDSSGFSAEIKAHYTSHFLPLLKKLVPGGEGLSLVFLQDPPKVEIRLTMMRP